MKAVRLRKKLKMSRVKLTLFVTLILDLSPMEFHCCLPLPCHWTEPASAASLPPLDAHLYHRQAQRVRSVWASGSQNANFLAKARRARHNKVVRGEGSQTKRNGGGNRARVCGPTGCSVQGLKTSACGVSLHIRRPQAQLIKGRTLPQILTGPYQGVYETSCTPSEQPFLLLSPMPTREALRYSTHRPWRCHKNKTKLTTLS